MRIDISDLKHQPGDALSFSGEENLGSLPFMGEDILFNQPLMVMGTVTHTNVGFLVSGQIKGIMARQCGRCTEYFDSPIESHFDLIFRQTKSGQEAEDKLADDDENGEEEEVILFQGNFLDIRDAIIESVVFAIPMKSLCSEDCEGLCPMCGQNLNENPCNCHVENEDGRLMALKQLLNKD